MPARPLLLALVLLMLGIGAARAADLTVTVDRIRSAQGQITFSLYDNRDAWLKDNRSVVDTAVPARAGSVSVVFRNLKPGVYAVVTMHDDNGDGHMDFTFLGMPKKGYAFSNNVRPFLSAPHFLRAAFTIGTTDAAILIHMVYP
jgi:uncharacterized protein (DUF2141 family)